MNSLECFLNVRISSSRLKNNELITCVKISADETGNSSVCQTNNGIKIFLTLVASKKAFNNKLNRIPNRH